MIILAGSGFLQTSPAASSKSNRAWLQNGQILSKKSAKGRHRHAIKFFLSRSSHLDFLWKCLRECNKRDSWILAVSASHKLEGCNLINGFQESS